MTNWCLIDNKDYYVHWQGGCFKVSGAALRAYREFYGQSREAVNLSGGLSTQRIEQIERRSVVRLLTVRRQLTAIRRAAGLKGVGLFEKYALAATFLGMESDYRNALDELFKDGPIREMDCSLYATQRRIVFRNRKTADI